MTSLKGQVENSSAAGRYEKRVNADMSSEDFLHWCIYRKVYFARKIN